MLTKALALELAQHGIMVNAIGPGVIDTGMSPLDGNDYGRWLLASIPLGRAGLPAEIAHLAAFLASDAADYITGTIVYVDGGWLLR
jgi:NAD(P)-dependent dehydrogenase (short-subunit alcohol dehydrogenase family)